MLTRSLDYYEVLQVSPKADQEVIQAAYSRLVDKWHAHRRPGDTTAFERLILLDEAFAVLSNPVERQEYDSRRRQALPIGEVKLESPQAAPPQPTTENSLTCETKEEAEKIQAVVEMSLREVERQNVVHEERVEGEDTKHGDSERLSKKQALGIVSPTARAIFALGVFFFLSSQQLNILNFLFRLSTWCLIFGIPFSFFIRWGQRSRITVVASVFCFAAGLDFAWQIRNSFTPLVEPVKFQYQPIVSETALATNSKLSASAGLGVRDSGSVPSTQNNQTEAYTLTQSGNAWQAKKEYDKAIENFNEAIRLDPTDAFAYSYRGDAWREKKEYDKAILDYDNAIRLNPNCAIFYSDRGDAWACKKKYDKAIDDFNEAIRLKPSARFYLRRGKAWGDKQEYDIAIRDYDEAIRLDPKNDLYYFRRGEAWFHKSNFEKAIWDYDQAIRLGPQEASYYYWRGFSRYLSRQYDFAIWDFNEVIRLDPKDGDAYRMRGSAWSAKFNYDKAIEDFNEAIRVVPQNSEGYRERASAWSSKKEYEKAIEDYEAAIRLEQQEKRIPMASRDLAWLLATCPQGKIRDGKRAIEIAEGATKYCERIRCTTYVQYFLEPLAAAHAEAGQFDEAVRYQLKSLEAPRFTTQFVSRDDSLQILKLYQQKKPYRDNR